MQGVEIDRRASSMVKSSLKVEAWMARERNNKE
jgi:hypothetical protein